MTTTKSKPAAALITPVAIRFPFSESEVINTRRKHMSWADADAAIRRAARVAPENGCYDKTDFVITWSDGTEYKGRIDIARKHAEQDHPLSQHVWGHMVFHGGMCDPLPSHATPESYVEYLRVVHRDSPSDYAQYPGWLRTHDLPFGNGRELPPQVELGL